MQTKPFLIGMALSGGYHTQGSAREIEPSGKNCPLQRKAVGVMNMISMHRTGTACSKAFPPRSGAIVWASIKYEDLLLRYPNCRHWPLGRWLKAFNPRQRHSFVLFTAAITLLAAWLPGNAQAWNDRDIPLHHVHISIGSMPKQTFSGFGASQPTDQQRLFSRYGANKVTKLANAVYGDLGMNIVRVWVHSGSNININYMKRRFYDGYITNGYLNILKRTGVRTILLAPTRGEGAPVEPMREYADKLAAFIRAANDEPDYQ